MVRVAVISSLVLAVASVAIAPVAAQQPDVPMLQRMLMVLEQQRNEAMNRTAMAETRSATLQSELQQVQAEIKRLKDKYEPEKKSEN